MIAEPQRTVTAGVVIVVAVLLLVTVRGCRLDSQVGHLGDQVAGVRDQVDRTQALAAERVQALLTTVERQQRALRILCRRLEVAKRDTRQLLGRLLALIRRPLAGLTALACDPFTLEPRR